MGECSQRNLRVLCRLGFDSVWPPGLGKSATIKVLKLCDFLGSMQTSGIVEARHRVIIVTSPHISRFLC